MIEITEEQSERISLILGGIKNAPNKAIHNVINRGLTTVKSQSSKMIRETYNIKQKDIKNNQQMKFNKATSSNLVGEISFAGNMIPLIQFNTRATSKGVTTSVMKGGGTRLNHAYITDLGKYGVGVFQRETTARDSSKQLYGPSTAHMMENNNVLPRVETLAQETVNKRIEHEITRILNGYV